MDRVSKAQLTQLLTRLHPSRVSTRTQGGTSLEYLEAWDVSATLTRIFGFGGWQWKVNHEQVIQVREAATHPQHMSKDGKAKTPVVSVLVRGTLTIQWNDGTFTEYTESAIGSNSQWNIDEAFDTALKTASSDALKRAARHLGTQFGLSLYDKGNKNDVVRVILEPNQAALLAEIREEQQKAHKDERAAIADEMAAIAEKMSSRSKLEVKDESLREPEGSDDSPPLP